VKDFSAVGMLDFAAVEVTFEATSAKGRVFMEETFGFGARSFVVRKTVASAAVEHLEALGFSVEVVGVAEEMGYTAADFAARAGVVRCACGTTNPEGVTCSCEHDAARGL